MAFSFWKKMFGDKDGEGASPVEAPSDVVVDAAGSSPAESCCCADAADSSCECGDSCCSSERVADSSDIQGLEGFVEYVAKHLVDNPDAVSVATIEKERISVIQIRCEKKDIGKIIGKSGKTIAAIRMLVSGAGGRMGLRMTVDVLD